jgi:ABC-2 type transport system permease protein
MKAVNLSTVYVLWLREMKKFRRSKSRLVGSLVTPLLFLGFFSFGFGNLPIPGAPAGVNYVQLHKPRIKGMGLLFSATFAGLTVLLDRQFGFLKEIMVAPVSRVSIVLGRTAGAITTGLMQALMILAISMAFQIRIAGVLELLLAVVFMVLTSTAFIGAGLIFASKMKDPQGFNLIVNFFIFPLFFLSGALFPLQNLPGPLQAISYADPLTYGVDGMRGALIGVSFLPLWIDFIVLLALSGLMIFLGAYFFEKSESV